MQDRYVGDIGDYGKYGLLRWLTGMGKADDGAVLRLGVNWYLFDGCEQKATNDGGFIQYLFKPSRVERTLPDCDPELYAAMQSIVKSGRRSVAEVERSGVLPLDTLYYSAALNFDDRDVTQPSREAARRKWVKNGLSKMEGAGIVFVDPDNGLGTPTKGRYSKGGPKYVYYDDLPPYWERGQSLIIYQHADRSGVERLLAERCAELRKRLSGANSIALRFRRRNARAYIILAQPHHADLLDERVRSFLASEWGAGTNPHFTRAHC